MCACHCQVQGLSFCTFSVAFLSLLLPQEKMWPNDLNFFGGGGGGAKNKRKHLGVGRVHSKERLSFGLVL